MDYFIKKEEEPRKYLIATDCATKKRICIQFGKNAQKNNKKISKLHIDIPYKYCYTTITEQPIAQCCKTKAIIK